MERVLRLKVPLDEAGKWDSETKAEGKVQHNYQWSPEQWKHIEMVAYRLILATMSGSADWGRWEDAITPEALDFWDEDKPDDLFNVSDDPDENNDNEINGCSTAIGVVDCILKQMEEEIGKRGGSLP